MLIMGSQTFVSDNVAMLAQTCQVAEAELADSNSRFRSVNGISVHYKAANYASAQASSAVVPAIAMYHGFGANTFSWSFVDRKLAAQLKALVVSHDMPGFGLTQRCTLCLRMERCATCIVGKMSPTRRSW